MQCECTDAAMLTLNSRDIICFPCSSHCHSHSQCKYNRVLPILWGRLCALCVCMPRHTSWLKLQLHNPTLSTHQPGLYRVIFAYNHALEFTPLLAFYGFAILCARVCFAVGAQQLKPCLSKRLSGPVLRSFGVAPWLHPYWGYRRDIWERWHSKGVAPEPYLKKHLTWTWKCPAESGGCQ